MRGFAYLLLLVLIAVLGLVSAGTVARGHKASRNQAELELLAIGAEFRAALISYRGGAQAAQAAGPAELQDLLRDPRIPGVRRHLRKVYADPLTGSQQWGLVRAANGRITGIYSLAPGEPIKQAGFDERYPGFDGAKSYSEWLFTADTAIRPLRVQLPDQSPTPGK